MAISENSNITIYLNTSENAILIGWVHIPEYTKGDSNLPFVAHDHVKGTFTYVPTTDG